MQTTQPEIPGEKSTRTEFCSNKFLNIWVYLRRSSSFLKIVENTVFNHYWQDLEIWTGIFGQMESSQGDTGVNKLFNVSNTLYHSLHIL